MPIDLPPMKCVDFDGSLTNPLELAAMGIWLLVLLVVLVPVGLWAGRRVRVPDPVAWGLGVAVVFVFPSAIARVSLATWLYRLHHPDVVSVGFFGGISPFSCTGVGRSSVVCDVPHGGSEGRRKGGWGATMIPSDVSDPPTSGAVRSSRRGLEHGSPRPE